MPALLLLFGIFGLAILPHVFSPSWNFCASACVLIFLGRATTTRS